MNREIKFRAWHPVLKQMLPNIQNHIGNDSWAFGHLLKNGEVEIMQYTGLKDKNGVEIYEGDIVLNRDNITYQILYIGNSFETRLSDGKKDIHGVTWYYVIEVIGNIFENPELLQP